MIKIKKENQKKWNVPGTPAALLQNLLDKTFLPGHFCVQNQMQILVMTMASSAALTPRKKCGNTSPPASCSLRCRRGARG